MSNPTQPDVLDRMIARLEEANAGSYKEPSRADETSAKSDHNHGHQSPSQPVASKRRPLWAGPWFVAVILLLIAAPVRVTSFAWETSYLDAVKLTLARWVNASVRQTGPEMSPQISAVPAPSIPPEMEQRPQKMADELADLQQRIGQLKAGQDQVSALMRRPPHSSRLIATK
jgi:hypothetical protein